MSSLCPAVSSRDSGVAAATITTARASSGTFSQKIQRQLASSMTVPPTSGPIASAMLDTAAQIPSARSRSSGGNATVAIASERPSSEAPPIP